EESAFMTGIMSLMDTLLGTPISEILSSIPVSQEVKDALTERSGTLGKLLDLAEDLEKGNVEGIEACLAECSKVSLHDVSVAQAEALKWSNSIAQTNE
ncbi:MAG: EAL domain-containing protein, partial [Burkholderiales bacterium]